VRALRVRAIENSLVRGVTFAIVVAAGVLADQLGKHWAHDYIRPRRIVPVLDGFFELRYSTNTGAFFSFGSDFPPDFRRFFFILASALALGLIVALYRREPQQKLTSWALALLASGAVGNLVDRIRSGAVIDFLHLHFREVFHWATFNLADVWIAAGLVLLLVDLARPRAAPKPAVSEG
jgi:signal peptidase II